MKITITGKVGSGKTTIINRIVNYLRRDLCVHSIEPINFEECSVEITTNKEMRTPFFTPDEEKT